MTNNLKGQQHPFEKYLHFHEDLLNVQIKNMQRLMAAIPFKKLNKINVNAEIENSGYIMAPQNITIEEKELEFVFDKIMPVMKKYYQNQDELKLLEDLNDKRKFPLKRLVEHVLSHDQQKWDNLSKEFKLSKELLMQFGEYLSTPYLELCSEYFSKKIKKINWERPICPICGSHPRMALVNEDMHQRKLWCHLCDTEWYYKETVCVVCQNSDLKTLVHIFPPEKSPYRIDACDKCHSYMKVIDKQLTNKNVNFLIENLSTYSLDVLATKLGYKNISTRG